MGVLASRNDLLVRTSDGHQMALQEPLKYVTDAGHVYVVPEGSTTDGASTPSELWAKLPPFGDYWLAAVLHDAAYRGTLLVRVPSGDFVPAMLTKQEADALFLEAMTSLRVDLVKKVMLYDGVKFLGYRAFRQNQQRI